MTTQAELDNDIVEAQEYVRGVIEEALAEYLGRRKKNAGQGTQPNQKEAAGQTAGAEAAGTQGPPAAPAQY